jgi:uncharacterized membrane protein YedE/YeeE
MTWQLGGSIAGLAALDSLNPATLVAITLILLSSRRRPLAEAIGFVIGAFTTVLLIGLALYVGAEAAASAIAGALTWLRRGAFGLAALVLFVSAVRSLRARRRATIRSTELVHACHRRRSRSHDDRRRPAQRLPLFHCHRAAPRR